MTSSEIIIRTETRMLASGRTFTRNRCSACKCYWDTGHELHPDEKEHHDAKCLAFNRKACNFLDMPAKSSMSKNAKGYAEYKLAQELAKLRIQLNQYGVLLSGFGEQLKVIAGMEERVIKRINEILINPSRK